jgi:hypothetical protein
LLALSGSSGVFYLFGSILQTDHPLLTQHLLSECRIPTFGQGRWVEVWKLAPNSGGENHWFDGMIGCAVGASVAGLEWSATGEPKPKRDRKKIDMGELYRRAREKPML